MAAKHLRVSDPEERPFVDRLGTPACRLALMVLESAALALLLEFGTLMGSRTASFLSPSDWSPTRIVIFFCLILALILYRAWGLSAGELLPLRARLSQRGGSTWCSLVRNGAVPVLVGLAAAALSALVFSMMDGFVWDYRFVAIPAVIAFLIALLAWNRRHFLAHLEYGFLAIALSFGTLFCVCMPVVALVSWDGNVHIRNAINVSYVVNAEYTAADEVMMSVPGVLELGLYDVEDLIDGNLPAVWQPKQDVSSDAYAKEILRALDGKDVIRYQGFESPVSDSYLAFNRVGYIPNAVGLWLGRLLHLDCLGQYFLARLTSMLFYVYVFFCAIRRLRSGKALAGALALLPTPLLMSANFSYDPWCYALISGSFIWYAAALQRRDGEMSGFEMLTIYSSFVLGALVKAVVFPIALVFFLAPRELIRDPRRRALWRVSAVLCVLFLLMTFALPFLMSDGSGGDSRGGGNVEHGSQVGFILSDPLGYMVIFASFLGEFLFASPLEEITSSFFPYLYETPAYFGLLTLCLLLVLAFLDRNPRDDGPLSGGLLKVAVVVGSLSALFLIALALYIDFTPVGSEYISGVQWRYMLPCFIPIFLFLLNSGRRIKAVPKESVAGVFYAGELVLMCLVTYVGFVSAF